MRFNNRGLGAAPGVKPRPQQMTPAQVQQQLMEQQRLRQQVKDASSFPVPNSNDEEVPPGALVQYYGDLSSGVLPPEDMRLESLQYRVQIAPDGTVNSESESVMLVARYNFAIRRVIGFCMDPSNAGAAPALVDFNIKEDGRNFTVFKTDMSMAAIANAGSSPVAEWDGVYITVPGTQLSVTWSIDTARWSSLVGATKEFGVQIIGDLIACRPTPKS